MQKNTDCEVVFDPLYPLDPLRCINQNCKNCQKKSQNKYTELDNYSHLKEYTSIGIEEGEMEFFEMVMAERIYQEKHSTTLLKNSMKQLKQVKPPSPPKGLVSTGTSTQSHIFNKIMQDVQVFSTSIKPKIIKQESNASKDSQIFDENVN